MDSLVFTAAEPERTVPLSPPTGSTACVITFTVAPPEGGFDSAGYYRLAHVRTAKSVPHPNLASQGRLPRESELLELVVRSGALSAGFSGKGGKNATNLPKHLGKAPREAFVVTLTIPMDGRDAVVAAGALSATSNTDIAPEGRALELLLGFTPVKGAELGSPIGTTIFWDADAVEWVASEAGA